MTTRHHKTICHNCKGTGNVDGGTRKRIRKELDELEHFKNQEINIIHKDKTIKDNKEGTIKRDIIEKIRKRYSKLLNNKSNESVILKNCFCCNGEGRRIK